MERHPEKLSEGVVRRNDQGTLFGYVGHVSPFNAGDALAVICEQYGNPIPRQHKARLGKAAKELLEDGFDPVTVCKALLIAVRRARVDLAPTIALELQSAEGGQYVSWQRYRSDLESFNRTRRADLDPIRRALRKEFRR